MDEDYTVRDDLDRLVQQALSAGLNWPGSPASLWSRVVSRLHAPRPWWKQRPYQAAAGVAVALVLTLGLRYTTGGPRPDGTLGLSGIPPALKSPALPALPPEPSDRIRGPASILARAELFLSVNETGPGEMLEIRVEFSTFQGGLVFDGEPVVRFWRIGQPYEHGPRMELNVAGLAITPGEQGRWGASLAAPQEPGWYYADLHASINTGSGVAQMTFGGPSLFVQYPAGATRTGSLAVNRSTSRDGHTVTANTVVMSARETSVSFSVSNVPAPSGFNVRLLTGDGHSLQWLGLSTRGSGEGITGEAVFGPVPAGVSVLILDVSGLPSFTAGGMAEKGGPWQVEIRLPE